jgi:hypothetical protein
VGGDNVAVSDTVLIEAEADFWSLIWQSVELTRFLTPVGACRTLRCVVDRLTMLGVTLDELARPDVRPDIVRSPAWFRSCALLEHRFDWDRFPGDGSDQHSLKVRSANDVERAECPTGTWYVLEGVHRMLAAAVLLDRGLISWRPFSARRCEPAAPR